MSYFIKKYINKLILSISLIGIGYILALIVNVKYDANFFGQSDPAVLITNRNDKDNRSFDDGYQQGMYRAVLIEKENKSIKEIYEATYDKDSFRRESHYNTEESKLETYGDARKKLVTIAIALTIIVALQIIIIIYRSINVCG